MQKVNEEQNLGVPSGQPLKDKLSDAPPRQLAYTARQMFLTRIEKYNDPRNLEWEWDDITDKWQRHAFSAFMDLIATEQERDSLIEALESIRGCGMSASCQMCKNVARAALAKVNAPKQEK